MKQLTAHVLIFLGVLGGTIALMSRLQQETRESVRFGMIIIFLCLYFAGIYDIYIKSGLRLKISIDKLLRVIFVVWIIPLLLGLLLMWYVFSQ